MTTIRLLVGLVGLLGAAEVALVASRAARAERTQHQVQRLLSEEPRAEATASESPREDAEARDALFRGAPLRGPYADFNAYCREVRGEPCHEAVAVEFANLHLEGTSIAGFVRMGGPEWAYHLALRLSGGWYLSGPVLARAQRGGDSGEGYHIARVSSRERDVLPGGRKEMVFHVFAEGSHIVPGFDDGDIEAELTQERLLVCSVEGAPVCTAPLLLRDDRRVRRLLPSGEAGPELAAVRHRLRPRFPGDGSLELSPAGDAPPRGEGSLMGRHHLFH